VRADDLDYELPEELIAQRPAEDRDGSRLLVVDAGREGVEHRAIRELPELLEPALWVVNDTRVLPARLRGHKPTGGAVELLLVEPNGEGTWRCMGRASKPLRPGLAITIGEGFVARVEGKLDGGMIAVRFEHEGPFEEALEAHGEIPLPPYVQRDAEASDRERYQTIFADRPGAIAAPTAGLHFTDALVAALEAAGHRFTRVTLHVGPGTFRPVKVDDLSEHPMHEERYEVPAEAAAAIADARADGRSVVAVGTTVVRTLESAASVAGTVVAGSGRTDLFIKPPFAPRVVDHLLTNFHLPRSTLLALVMALGGEAPLRAAYAEAVRARYRFFSYGDAMLIRGCR
jgi:S-adenosylmethionine:tRNA ribosyltransferase-isomerase